MRDSTAQHPAATQPADPGHGSQVGTRPADVRHILVVDDEEAIQFAMRRFLEGAGYRVDCAGEKEEAEALLCHRRYDAAILDLRLSAVGLTDGLDLVRFVRTRSPNAWILLLSAYGSEELEKEARARGAHAFLHKPQSLERITQLLQGWWSRPS